MLADHGVNFDKCEGQSLPGWVYYDPDFFRIEMERVIRPNWQVVCHVSDIQCWRLAQP